MGPRQPFSRLAFVIPILLGLLVFAAWRAPATAPPPPYATITLKHGLTLLKAPGTLHLSLPYGYFATGSAA